MKSDISVVVPCYNSASTIKKCIGSIINQTCRELEILVIDGGSDDGTCEIVEKMSEQDGRIRLIRSEKKGVSAQRNRGIKESAGTFFQFVDSDDELPPDACEKMLRAITAEEADIVIAGYRFMSNGLERIPKEGIYDGVLPFLRELPEYYKPEKLFLNSPCNKLYRRDVIRAHFPENMEIGEDLLFNLDAIRTVRRIVVRSEIVYLVNDYDKTSLSRRFRPDGFEVETYLYKKMKAYTESFLGSMPEYLYGVYIEGVKVKLFHLVVNSDWSKKDIQREIYRWCGNETLADTVSHVSVTRIKDRVMLRWIRKKRVRLIYFYYKHFG